MLSLPLTEASLPDTPHEIDFDAIGALLGDRSRARIMRILMAGRALTAKELAFHAEISAPTASAHLKKLIEGRLIEVHVQGRNRYHFIADEAVAQVIEGLMVLSAGHAPATPSGPADGARFARTCYRHLAGRVGVELMQHLIDQTALHSLEGGFVLTERGRALLGALDLVLVSHDALRACMDWSERRRHLSGPLATALLDRFVDRGWLSPVPDSRALVLTEPGRCALERHLGLQLPR